MDSQSINLYGIPFETLFHEVKRTGSGFHYDYAKHSIQIEDEGGKIRGNIRLPLHTAISDDLDIISKDQRVLYLTIESGQSALILVKGIENVYHTTFSAYMTRKKQGMSQIKYLNKKGKSRAGSRIRLAKTIEFFEKINTSLTNLLKEHRVDRIGLDCNKTLIPYLYGSKIICPFDKKDERLYKIPVHIPQSNYTNLSKVIKKLMAPILFYNTEYSEMFIGLQELSRSHDDM